MDEHRPNVIVSSNRYDDLEPYCSYIYNDNPKTWDAIFPWEFPQDGTKDEEEQFLRLYFSEDEIHVQGFRFLKQAWYCIALFNLNKRIPAFTEWWLRKPSSIELLNDTQLQPFLFRQDVKPSTFFADEIPEYGEKFLTNVIPLLQHRAKDILEKAKAVNKSAPAGVEYTASPKRILWESSDGGGPKTAQSLSAEVDIIRTTLNVPSPNASSFGEIPHSAPPLMTAVEMARQPMRTSNGPQMQSRTQIQNQPQIQTQPQVHGQQRKRGNSFKGRFNTRAGGHFPTRQPPSSSERNTQAYPVPVYAPMHPRVTSGGPPEWMPPLSQGQPLHAMPSQFQSVSGKFGHPGAIPQHHMPQEVFFAPSHEPYFNTPFGDRTNIQLPGRDFAAELQPHQSQYFHDPDSYRGGHRRNSQGSRGGKPPRGHNNRGRNSRGRNSFTSFDQPPPFKMHGENINPTHFGDVPGNAYPHKNRRPTAIFEKNWRSGSEHPQTHQNEPAMMKENIFHGQQFGRPEHPYFAQPEQRLEKTVFPPDAAFSAAHKPVHRNTAPVSYVVDPDTLRPDQKCGNTWIGEHCTFVDRLLVFDVPEHISDDMVSCCPPRSISVGKPEIYPRVVAILTALPMSL